jgi:hypothetical protein
MTDHLDQAVTDALNARPWILAPTLPRNDRQTFELGFRAGWDARAARGDELRITREILTRVLDGDPGARAAARLLTTGGDR